MPKFRFRTSKRSGDTITKEREFELAARNPQDAWDIIEREYACYTKINDNEFRTPDGDVIKICMED
jgi:hypothetical protein